MYRKQKTWAVVITIGMSVFLAINVQAENLSNIFSDWQGEFMSREFVNETPEMDAVYKKVVIEAKKLGKNYTKERVRGILKRFGKLYWEPYFWGRLFFQAITIGLTIHVIFCSEDSGGFQRTEGDRKISASMSM